MARKTWVVLVEDFENLGMTDRYRNEYFSSDPHNPLLSLFLTQIDADRAAKELAVRHPGKDIHVFTPDYGFTAPPKPTESKVWTADGQFIPKPSE
jgi:hypothetical protein